MSDSSFVTSIFRKGIGTAEMGGWDTIYAVRTPLINDALRRHFADNPDTLRFRHEHEGCGIEGVFGPWQITTGGSGRQLRLHLPIVSGTATLNGLGVPLEYDLSRASAIAEITLGFHPVSSKPDGSALRAELRINGRRPAPSGGDAASIGDRQQYIPADQDGDAEAEDPPITVRSLTGVANKGAKSPLDSIAPGMISHTLAAWLLEHAEVFDFAFLSVNIATEAAKTLTWLAPSHVCYAIAHPMQGKEQTHDVEHSIFAIMAMTEGRDPDGASDTLTANAIPLNEGVNASFLISPRLILEKFLLPGLPALFDAKPGDFILGSNGKTIENCSDLHLKLQMENSTYLGTNPVPATITVGNFSLTLTDTHLVQDFKEITFPYGNHNELDVQMSLAGQSQLGIDENKHFALLMEPNPRATLSAQPDQRKVAMEQIVAMGVTLVLMLGTSFLFARMAGAARSGQAATRAVTQAEATAAEVASVAESGAARAVSVEVAAEANVVSSSTVTAELVETTAAEMQQGSSWTFSGFFERFCAKTLTMMLAQTVSQMAGQVIGNISNFDLLSLYKNEPSKLPTLATFGTHCISATEWPHTEGATLLCAGLNGPLALGFALEKSPESGKPPRASMNAIVQAPRRGVPTMGWDLVYAVEIGRINARIAARQEEPRLFHATYGDKVTVQGALGAWKIVPGGSGHLVFLRVPILDALLRQGDHEQAFQGAATLSFSLTYLEEASGHTLRVRHDTNDKDAAFQIEKLEVSGLSGLMARSIVETALQEWLAAHDDAFEHVFATIQLEALQSDSAHAWLKPTTVSYAYADRPARGDGVLAILAMTNGRPGDHLAQQVMASAITDDQAAAMLISPHLLLDWLIRPSLPLAYPGTKREDFEFVGDFPMLQLQAPCKLTVDADSKLPAAPTLEALTISFNGNEFVCVSETSVSDGTITEHRRCNSRQVLRMQTDANGKPGIAFVQQGQPDVRSWTTVNPEAQASANKAAEWIMAVGTVVAIMVGGPIAVTIMVISVVTSGLIKISPVLAALAHQYLSKPYVQNVDLLALNAFRPFAWHGGADFSLESVDLAESLRISGSPWPSETSV